MAIPDRAHLIRTALLRPRSIALVGASDDPAKTSSRPLQYLRRAGYAGTVYPINPRASRVLSERAWPSLSALPEAPDHAFILTSTAAACAAVAECASLGVKAVTILAGGFSEAGPEGIIRARAVADQVRRAGMVLLGPSSLGLTNVDARLVLTANAAFAEPDMPVGRLFVASHSGSMMGALLSRGKSRGIGYAGMVSVGNETDLSVGEICLANVDDPAIDSYLLFLESIRHSDWLRRFGQAAASRGKPVVVYKLGRSEAGAELAMSHTGALAGEDAAADAFLRDCGFARVETLEGAIEAIPLLRRSPCFSRAVPAPRVGVVTTTGGGAAMVVDQLALRGAKVVAPEAATLERLATAGVQAEPGRIVDLTLAGTRYDVMKKALLILLAAAEFDVVVAVAGSSARFQPDLVVRPIIDVFLGQQAGAKPLVTFVTPDAPDALLQLAEAGVPCFRTPESCADVIVAGFSRRPCRTDWGTPPSEQGAGRVMLDELQAYSVLARLGIRHASVRAVALPTEQCAAATPSAGVGTSSMAPHPTPAFPVAVKVLSRSIAHKTDIGGVVLGVRDDRALQQALASVARSVRSHHPAILFETALVQSMVGDIAGEVLVGYRVDPDAGPLIMLSAGGVLAEIYCDRSLRTAPVTLDGAREMIGEVRALKALSGYRGRPPADLEALAEAVVALSLLAVRPELGVMEAEINPLMVHPQGHGVTAVDAVAWIVASAAQATGRPLSAAVPDMYE